MLRTTFLLVYLLAFVACGSADPDKAKTDALKRAVQQTHKLFEMTQTNAMANASFYSVPQLGGSGIHYLVASLPERGTIRCYEEVKPSGPWCVVVRNGPGKLDITIEGYGAKLDSPVITQVAKLGEYKRF